jgi:hypothetical protein
MKIVLLKIDNLLPFGILDPCVFNIPLFGDYPVITFPVMLRVMGKRRWR